MKKKLLVSVCSMLITKLVIAQTSPIVLVSLQGELSYKGESKKELKIVPGALLSVNGHLKVKDKTTAVLLCNEGFNILMEGKPDLKKLCGGSTSMRSIGVDDKFGSAILSAIELTYMAKEQNSGWVNVKDPKMEAGDGWGAGDKGGWGAGDKGGWGAGDKGGWGAGDKGGWGAGDKGGWGAGDKGGWGAGDKGGWGAGDKGGWGGQGNIITLIMPVGKISAKQVRFSWSQPANANGYKLVIKDGEGNQIDSVETKDTSAIVDISKMKLNPGSRYSWSVTSLGANTINSNKEQFEVIAGDAKKMIQPKLSKSKIYYKLDPTAKLLLEASAYENEELFYQAYEIHMKIRKQDPKNNLAKMMHAAFWMKGGIPQMANMAVN